MGCSYLLCPLVRVLSSVGKKFSVPSFDRRSRTDNSAPQCIRAANQHMVLSVMFFLACVMPSEFLACHDAQESEPEDAEIKENGMVAQIVEVHVQAHQHLVEGVGVPVV